RYDYDDHDQMMKAKYFHGKDESKLTPLTHRSFAREIPSIDEPNSKKIWDALTVSDFLRTDCTNPDLCHGRQGSKSMFKTFVQRHRFNKHLEAMLSKAIVDRQALSEKDFMDKCQRWIEGSHVVIARCESVKKTLNHNRVLGNNPQGPLSTLQEEFVSVLRSFANHIPDIVRVLTHHFAMALGRSAGDVQSYEIDANGNHRMFYTGFTRYRMEYREGTNQITKVHRLSLDRDQRREQSFEMEHNSDGAVVKAEHKGIKKIEYDRILHRVSKIEMLDGRRLEYQYDVRGERTFKKVMSAKGSVLHEKYYIRNAEGIVLVDMEMTYLENDQPPDVRVTSYIYKDQQLIGFVRDDQLYSLVTDHEGSVRVVIKDGEVVAAYDYLPYGQIFRQYGTDLDGQISFLYTGQEWEPEIGLYNYRARLYDPDIGRFYQMDPKEQYASPYVYAGNSPVSLVDPDGEFAFALAIFVMAIVGAYIGASAANNSWNPLKWDWKSSSTWLGMLTGAITGASIPFNLA
ncbi:tRNA(Glu)-specific nuclease WapA-like, partial [Anopheles bellator]|uniref:tRNA(Glu)-specific nuclease WapA-like n=1 Tax=Anopheles bellator TaxID=139047 RepID=UPI002649F1F4